MLWEVLLVHATSLCPILWLLSLRLIFDTIMNYKRSCTQSPFELFEKTVCIKISIFITEVN